jgi:hypothetical protein
MLNPSVSPVTSPSDNCAWAAKQLPCGMLLMFTGTVIFTINIAFSEILQLLRRHDRPLF